jgi:hypothetical protein
MVAHGRACSTSLGTYGRVGGSAMAAGGRTRGAACSSVPSPPSSPPSLAEEAAPPGRSRGRRTEDGEPLHLPALWRRRLTVAGREGGRRGSPPAVAGRTARATLFLCSMTGEDVPRWRQRMADGLAGRRHWEGGRRGSPPAVAGRMVRATLLLCSTTREDGPRWRQRMADGLAGAGSLGHVGHHAAPA